MAAFFCCLLGQPSVFLAMEGTGCFFLASKEKLPASLYTNWLGFVAVDVGF
jgi:hypothetical protein